MSQCVPRLDLDENFVPPMINPYAYSNSSNYLPLDVPSLDYQVTELTWGNVQPSMDGLASPTRAAGTLESIVNQATRHHPQPKSAVDGGGDNIDELVRWLQRHRDTDHPAASASVDTMTMDALVPCNNINNNNNNILIDENQERHPTDVLDFVPCSTRVGIGSSCKPIGSVSESATFWARESRQLMLDSTYEIELGGTGYTSTSLVSPENTISGIEYTNTTAGDDHDSVSHSISSQACGRDQLRDEEGKKGTGKLLSVSTKRSRAAANHNQSERKRRDRINQRIKTLQKMVPNSCKTDKASILDEVIEYLKKLQAQVHMMSMSPMMLPLAMQQQQLQMSIMAGMGMGAMDMNISRAAAGVPPVIYPAATFNQPPPPPVYNPGDSLTAAPPSSVVSDPLLAFLA